MNWTHTPLALSALMFAMAAQATPNQATDAVAPEQATGFEHKSLVKAKNWMVTAANPLASEAGASILRQGGNAIDAMVTTQLMLGLVEPQSSGIGGGSFWSTGMPRKSAHYVRWPRNRATQRHT